MERVNRQEVWSRECSALEKPRLAKSSSHHTRLVASIESNQAHAMPQFIEPPLFGCSLPLLSLHPAILKTFLGLVHWELPNWQFLNNA